MIPALFAELAADVKAVLENTVIYGFLPDSSGHVRFSDVGESIVAMEKWCWISRYDLRQAIALSIGVDELQDEAPIAVTRKIQAGLPPYTEASESTVSLFVGAANAVLHILLDSGPRAGPRSVRAVADATVAACIAIFRTDFGNDSIPTQPGILQIDVSAARLSGSRVRKTPSMFYVIEDLQPTSCSPFPDAESVLKAATWKVRLHETLFMEHADQARRAAEFLFRLKQQPDVERALTAHLKHPFQEVRRNVAQALGLPSFQASISLKMPPPTLKNLLEPVTVQPDTLKQMLSAINTEADLEVLHWLLCTVSAQFFGGKLRPFIRETETLSRELDAKFGSQLSSDTISLRKALSQQA